MCKLTYTDKTFSLGLEFSSWTSFCVGINMKIATTCRWVGCSCLRTYHERPVCVHVYRPGYKSTVWLGDTCSAITEAGHLRWGSSSNGEFCRWLAFSPSFFAGMGWFRVWGLRETWRWIYSQVYVRQQLDTYIMHKHRHTQNAYISTQNAI